MNLYVSNTHQLPQQEQIKGDMFCMTATKLCFELLATNIHLTMDRPMAYYAIY